jgi:cytosine/adenosine deaminase-related metal-dependent hydrolase
MIQDANPSAAEPVDPEYLKELRRKAEKYDLLVRILKERMEEEHPQISESASLLEELGELDPQSDDQC